MTWTHEVYCVIEMSNKEFARKTEVERVIDHRITQKEAARKLGITERQFRHILKHYRQEGVEGLVSRKRGILSNRRTDAEVREEVRKFITDPLRKDFGATFMAEKPEQKKDIKLSKETVRRMMIADGVWNAKTKKEEKLHLSRPRRKSRGELVGLAAKSGHKECLSWVIII